MAEIKKRQFKKARSLKGKSRNYKSYNAPFNQRSPQKNTFLSTQNKGLTGVKHFFFLGFEKVTKLSLTLLYLVLFFSSGVMLEDALSYVFDQAALTVQSIDVIDSVLVSKKEVLERSGIIAGDNVLDYDLRLIKERIEKIDKIYSASVKRLFPGKIVITLNERQPVMRLEIGGELLDRDGKSIDVENGFYYYKHLPVISGFNLTPFGVLPKTEFLRYKEELKKVDLLNNVLEIVNNSVVKITVNDDWTDYTLKTGAYIRLSRCCDERVLKRIPPVLDDLRRRGVAYTALDMRFKDVVVKVKK